MKFSYLFLFFVVVLASFLRFFYLDFSSMWLDETLSAMSSQYILERGFPIFESGMEYSRALIYHYFSAFFLLIFQGDFGARFFSALIGVFTVVLGYFFGNFIERKFFDLKKDKVFGLGVFFALILAISSIQIIYSMQDRMYQFLQFFYVLTLFLFLKVVVFDEKVLSKKRKDLVLILICSLIAVETHIFGAFLFAVFGVFFVFDLFLKHNFNFSKVLENFERYMNLNFKDRIKVDVFVLAVLFVFIFVLVDFFSNISHLNFKLNLILENFGLYFDFLFPNIVIFIMFLFGVIYALYKNFRLHFLFVLSVILPFFILIFLDVFASRYLFFVNFFVLFYVVFFIYNLKLKFLLFFVFIFAFLGSYVVLEPVKDPLYDFSMPQADFKGAYGYLSQGNYSSYSIVSTWTPASLWYYNWIPEYWLFYDIDGFSSLEENAWTVRYDEDLGDFREIYANSPVVKSLSDLNDDFVLVLDEQAERKLSTSNLFYIAENCQAEFVSYNIKVLICE